MVKDNKRTEYLIRTAVLLFLGILYMMFVLGMFLFQINLAENREMQNVIHFIVILSAFAYLFFTDMICQSEPDKENVRLTMLFSALFTIPILLGRGLGIGYINQIDFSADNIFNFYADISYSRMIELLSWTTFFPLSMLFLSKLFFKKRKGFRVLAWLCLSSSICCFTAFLSFFSPKAIFMFIGLFGWGIIFLIIIIIYLMKQIKESKIQ